MRASFFRNIPDYESLCVKSTNCKGISADYRSIAKIRLSDKDFSCFCDDFLKGYDYLLPYVDKAVVSQGVWHCVSVVYDNIVVLVMMDHYQYPRYVALMLS